MFRMNTAFAAILLLFASCTDVDGDASSASESNQSSAPSPIHTVELAEETATTKEDTSNDYWFTPLPIGEARMTPEECDRAINAVIMERRNALAPPPFGGFPSETERQVWNEEHERLTDVRIKPLCKPEAFASQLEPEYGGTLVDEHPLSPEYIHSSTYRADELLGKYPYVAEVLETDGFYPEELVVPEPGFDPYAVFRMSVELVAPLRGEGLPDTFILDHARVGDSMEGIALVNSPDYEHDAVRSIWGFCRAEEGRYVSTEMLGPYPSGEAFQQFIRDRAALAGPWEGSHDCPDIQ